MSDTVLAFLAERLTESGRELEGAVHRLRASYQLTDEPVTIAVAEQIVRDLMRGAEPRRVRIDDILRTVSKHYGVNRGDLLSGRRNRSIVRPRQIGMYLAKLLTSRSLPEIGRRFGNRDHTTVLHAIRKIEQLMSDDNQLREEIELLKRLAARLRTLHPGPVPLAGPMAPFERWALLQICRSAASSVGFFEAGFSPASPRLHQDSGGSSRSQASA